MASRLARWRAQNGIQSATIAKLCGFSVDDLAQIETGGTLSDADRLSLLLLFDDELSIGDLLGSRIAGDEDAILRRMDHAFRATCLKWTGKSA